MSDQRVDRESRISGRTWAGIALTALVVVFVLPNRTEVAGQA